MTAFTYSTVALLATGYTHTLMTIHREDGSIRKNVICNRINLSRVADKCATSPHAPPTCPLCAKRDPRSKSGYGVDPRSTVG